MQEHEVSIRDICSLVNRLATRVTEMQDSLDMLEAEVLALGSILVRRKLLTVKELDQATASLVKQKTLEKQTRRQHSTIPMLREELEEALQKNLRQ